MVYSHIEIHVIKEQKIAAIKRPSSQCRRLRKYSFFFTILAFSAGVFYILSLISQILNLMTSSKLHMTRDKPVIK